MSLITLARAHLAFGDVALLDDTDFSLEAGERVGLIGRNGTGKSSMLRILAGLERPDDGTVQYQQGITSAFVPQEPDLTDASTVFETVREGLADVIELTQRYARGDGDLNLLQTAIESLDGWNWRQRVDEALQRLALPPDAVVGTLSGGTRKRVALARALVRRPDVLLLDEPTNHLDLQAIQWLEDLLIAFRGSVVVITHDRSFLDRVATRIVELDRGHLLTYPGNFSAYQAQKEEQLAQEAVINAKSDKLLVQEEVWVRRGVEARRTRSRSRIVRLEQLRRQRAERREALGRARMELVTGQAGGKLVAELTDVCKAFPDVTTGSPRVVVRDFTAAFLRGDKVGLIGPNGAGKTTLLRLILGQMEPDSGRVRQGTGLQVAYFDQMRAALDLEAALEDFISPGSEWIELGTQRKHVKSYLGDFLFSPARARSPVRSLSGGERNRLLLARLFAQPANVLVLDEPTNDLDIDTLELLEELLQDYAGTVFIVSHDRAFLDNVVTSVVAFEGDGRWREYEGGITDWQTQSRRAAAANPAPATAKAIATPTRASGSSPATAPADPRGVRRKLGYKEQRELEALPGLIEQLESEQKAIEAELGEGSVYRTDPARAQQLAARSSEIEDALMTALERWETLGAS